LEAATKACARGQPNETGGLILGYWASKSEAVVQEITFAGPEAIGGAYSFDPDYEHDAELVAERYANSDGITTYLGDWHSHPNTMNAYLSKKDRAVLKRIAQSPDARAPRPLAMVLAGVDSYCKLKVRFGDLRPPLLGWQRLRVEECDIQLF
jgi:integrative and conjugative element protein (TIGR02256 family)